MKCSICGFEVETIDEDIENSWLPFFMKEKRNMARYVLIVMRNLLSKVMMENWN
jgi:hypothetical protein